VGVQPKVAKAYLHQWEEPCISALQGSGTVFFSGCNLKCVYCQNHEISHKGYGKYITCEKLAEIFKNLEEQGATNINLVSPTHYVEAIRKAFEIYKPRIPIVYNSGGYDSLECLEVLKDYIDIYLVDFKYYSSELANRLSKAEDYRDVAKSAILKMREYQPENVYDGEVMKKGVIIRHLILPNHTDDSIEIMKWIKENVPSPCISLMGQYTPMHQADRHEDISRKLKPIEYKMVAKAVTDLGLTDGYFQELSSATDEYTPHWDLQGIIEETKKEDNF
jgi:putative pyruvate formate lyase activating enzyme